MNKNAAKRSFGSVASALSVGDTIEVFYILRAKGERIGKQVWWPGIVTKAVHTTEASGDTLEITVFLKHNLVRRRRLFVLRYNAGRNCMIRRGLCTIGERFCYRGRRENCL